MKKDFLDELLEELQKLKDEQKKITLPAPIAPHKVIGVVNRVAKNHELTPDETQAILAMSSALGREITPAEFKALRDLDDR